MINSANDAVLRNEAEYRRLIAGLKDLVGRIERAGKAPADYSLLVHIDSQLMVGQVTHLGLRPKCRQGWQVKVAKLRPLVDEAKRLVQASGRFALEEALFGVENGDDEALRAGLAGFA